MTKATKKHINDALDYEITTWRELQRSAINNVNWPSISGDSEPFKAATMFNFGVSAASTIYPAAQAIASKVAVPLWILGQAQTAFQSMYQASVDDANKKLSNNYTSLADAFTNKIQNTARNFINSKHCRNMSSEIYQKVKDIEFKDDAQCKTLLRTLIYNANLIDTDASSIRSKTNEGFGRLCTKIRDIWKGTYRDPWAPDALLYFSPSYQTNLYRGGHVGQSFKRVRSKENQDWLIRNAHKVDVRYVKRSGNRQDNCYITLSKLKDVSHTFKTPNIHKGSLNQAINKLKHAIVQQRKIDI